MQKTYSIWLVEMLDAKLDKHFVISTCYLFLIYLLFKFIGCFMGANILYSSLSS